MQKSAAGKGNVRPVLMGVLAAGITMCLLSLIVSVLIQSEKCGMENMPFLLHMTALLAGAAGGITAGKKAGQRRAVTAMTAGALTAALRLVLRAFGGKGNLLSGDMLISTAMLLVGAAAAGLLAAGGGRRRKHKKAERRY